MSSDPRAYRRRPAGLGDVARAGVGMFLLTIGTLAWIRYPRDLATILTGARYGWLPAGAFVAISLVGGLLLVLTGLFWRGKER